MNIKLSEISASLTRINFILCEDKSKTYHVESDAAYSFYYPENGVHNNYCVRLMADMVKYHADKKIVIHTFNDVFINWLGRWIEEGVLPKEDVKIFIINGEEAQISTFDNTGVLTDWPYGWFMADCDINYFKNVNYLKKE